MNKFKENFLKYWLSYLITGLISAIIGVIIFLLFYFIKESAVNGATVAFVVNFSIGILMWVGYNGAFDSLSYGFKQLFTASFARKANKYNDFPGYLQDKRTKRSHSAHLYWSFIVVSIIFAITMIVLYAILKTQ